MYYNSGVSVLAQTEGDTGYDYNDAYDDDYDDDTGNMVYNEALLARYSLHAL